MNKTKLPAHWTKEMYVEAILAIVARPQHVLRQHDRVHLKGENNNVVLEISISTMPRKVPRTTHATPRHVKEVAWRKTDGTTTEELFDSLK